MTEAGHGNKTLHLLGVGGSDRGMNSAHPMIGPVEYAPLFYPSLPVAYEAFKCGQPMEGPKVVSRQYTNA